MSKMIFTNGEKAVSLFDTDDPRVWNFLSNTPQTDQDKMFAGVAAAYRAFHLTANTVAHIPFVLMKGKQEYDTSATWENKVGFMKRPRDIFRRNVLSLMATNSAYDLRTTDTLGYKTRGLYPLIPYTIAPITNPATGELMEFQRKVGGNIEHYKPDDPALIRIWKLDHTTEVLPSANTDAQAMMNAAGVIYYSDMWVRYFFQRGGIKPTLIAVKGMVGNNDTKEEREKDWTNWLRGLQRFTHRIARIINGDTMDVKPIGSGVDDFKDNKIYEQAIANVALATGIPLDVLLSDAANYATAEAHKSTWFDNTIVPWCELLAEEYNSQVFEPLGLRLDFKPETLDPEQEDETSRASAVSTFVDFLNKCPSADIALETALTFGYELTDGLVAAINAHFEEKKKTQNMPPDAQPGTDYNPRPPREPAIPPDANQPAKWMPSLNELEDMRVWREVALRRFKKGESLDFEYQPHHGGLPSIVAQDIALKLTAAQNADAIKAAFEIESTLDAKADPGILSLAQAMNNLAEQLGSVKQLPEST